MGNNADVTRPTPDAADKAKAVDASTRIKILNDQFRRSLLGGKVMMTPGLAAHGAAGVASVLERVRRFDAFTADNDPHGEHDFGAFEEAGEQYFWKIDYFDRELEFASPDPADPAATTRVLTLMLAEEY